MDKEKNAQQPPGPAMENDDYLRRYRRFIKYQNNHKEPEISLEYQPKFSFVIPVYNTITEQLRECFDSVSKQTYRNFECVLVDDHSSWENVADVLKEYENKENFKVVYRSENGHISRATNDGIEKADGDYIVFMDCDDTIESDTLYQFARKLNEDPKLDFIYSDEDKLTEDGKLRHMPFFKPDWSPDLYMCENYTNHLSVFRASIVKEIGGLRSEYNGSQDYDFTLRFIEKTTNNRIGHIPKVLYHWRERKESVAYQTGAKTYAQDAALRAKQDYLKRNGIDADTEFIPINGQYRVVYRPRTYGKVSIIIPSKDNVPILKQCIESVLDKTDYPDYEIIVVDNGSCDETKEHLTKYLAEHGAKYIYEKMDFNFSKMCNMGVDAAEGEFYLFLNDDIEVIQNDWMTRMVGQAERPHVGAVGAKLYYPDSTLIQHCGIINKVERADHIFAKMDDRKPLYFALNYVDSDCIAVTAACLMIQKDKYHKAGGFCEELAVTYNDVDLCFKLHSLNYYNVIRNDVCLYHYESLSRGLDALSVKKYLRSYRERMMVGRKYPELNGRDPFVNTNIHAIWEDGPDFKDYYDELETATLQRYPHKVMVYIDPIHITDRVIIHGATKMRDPNADEDLKKYLILKDPMGNTLMTEAIPMRREDLVGIFGNEKYLYCGFEAVFKKEDLHPDMIQYRIGVITEDKNGNRAIGWSDRRDTAEWIHEELPEVYCGNPIETPKVYPKPDMITGKIESVDFNDDCRHWHLQGYAFANTEAHWLYTTSLLLTDTKGRVREYPVNVTKRPDVAREYIYKPFLLKSGFDSYIYADELEEGEDYRITIRLRNCIYKDDIMDLETDITVGACALV